MGASCARFHPALEIAWEPAAQGSTQNDAGHALAECTLNSISSLPVPHVCPPTHPEHPNRAQTTSLTPLRLSKCCMGQHMHYALE